MKDLKKKKSSSEVDLKSSIKNFYIICFWVKYIEFWVIDLTLDAFYFFSLYAIIKILD